MKIKTSYSDLLNNPLSNEQTIDVTSYVKQFKNIFSIFREEPIENIARSIKGIHEETQKTTRDFKKVVRELDTSLFKKKNSNAD